MAGACTTMGFGEAVPIYSGAWVPTTGTETLSAVVCTLRDAQGAVAGGVSGTVATGFTSGASAVPVAWFDLDPTALGLTEPTTAQAIYSLEFTATDSLGKRYTSVVIIVVKPRGV